MAVIATWNVNSARSRAGLIAEWLGRVKPDLLLMQEIKCEEGQFPRDAFREAGYEAIVVGQKSYNGVAILYRSNDEAPPETLLTALPGDDDDSEARFVEVCWRGLVVGDLYLPNGNSRGADGFRTKLDWMARLRAHAAELLAADRDVMLAGDYNVCPTEDDLARGALPGDDALVRPESRAAFRALLWLGLTDAARALHPADRIFTFWDYQGGAWQHDRGLRIDHALLSARPAERLREVTIDRPERSKDKPSDHVPVIFRLDDPE